MADELLDKVVDLYKRDRQGASADVIGAFDSDPEEAAESVRLAKRSGADSTLINADLDGFKNQQKVMATSSIVDSNAFIREFLNSDPIVPKLVHDDIGNLDKLTFSVGKTFDKALMAANPFYLGYRMSSKISGGPGPIERGYVSTMLQQNPELVGQFLKGASYGTPDLIRGPMMAGSKALIDLSKLSPEEYKKQQESIWNVGGPMDAISWFLEQAGSAAGSATLPALTGGLGAAAGIPGGPPGMAAGGFLGFSSMAYIVNYGEVHQALEKAGVDEATAQKYATIAAVPITALDMTGIGFAAGRFMKAGVKKEAIDTIVAKAKAVGKEIGLAGGVEAGTEGIQEVIKDAFVSNAAAQEFLTKEHMKGWVESALAGFAGGAAFGSATGVVQAWPKAKPFVDAGMDPPAGLDPALDKLKGDQVKQDMKRLDGILDDANGTQLKGRSPEHLSGLLKRQVGETDIEVSKEAIRKLYGDKLPAPDDGLLGWVPDLEQQMSINPNGGYVSIKYRDWVANVTKDIQTELHDDILTRPAGLTINEAKTQAATEVVEPTPTYDSILPQEQQRIQELTAGLEQAKTPEEAEQIKAEIAQRQQIVAEPASAEIIRRNGQVIVSTRTAASLDPLINLGPQAEYMLFQNRLQMQALMDRLTRAEGPEQVAALREELKNVAQTLRARGWEVAEPGPPEVPGPPGWISAKQPPEVTISFVKGGVKFELDVKPIATDTLQDVISQLDFSPISAFGSYLQPITNRILALASNVPVHVVSDADFAKLFDAAGIARKPRGFHTTYTLFGDHIVFPSSIFHGNRNVLARLVYHEAIHAATSRALYDMPVMTRTVKTLMDSLEADNPELKKQYGYKNVHEFLAEALSNREFQDLLGSMQMSEQLATGLGMREWTGRTVWQALVESIRRALNIPEGAFSALEGALRVTELVMGAQEVALAQREARVAKVRSKEAEGVAETMEAPPKQLEMHGVTRQEDLKIFEEARTIGLTVDQYIKIVQNMNEQDAEDTALLLKQVEKFVRKKQTKEWKDALPRVKSEVEEALLARPDIALATFFRTGRLYGVQQGIPKIDRNDLTPEQRKLIPKRWQGERGATPEEVATLVGYTDVDQMALRAALLEERMVAAKQPSLRKYVDGLIRDETERRMVKEFGGQLEENIVKETMDHVVSPTQMDRLHEHTVAMGMKNGWEMPFTKADVVNGVKAKFGKQQAIRVSEVKELRDAGKAGKLAGIASEIEGDSREFFKQAQAQETSLRLAGEAKKLEKEMETFGNTVERLGRREARTIEQSYFNYAQGLLNAVGLKTKNSVEEIAASIDAEGHGTLDGFVATTKGTTGGDLELFVPHNYKPKQFDQMTVDEFREFKTVIDAIEDAGRRERQYLYNKELMDFNDLRALIIAHVRESGKLREPGANIFYRIDSDLTRLEEVVKDLDARKDLGPLWWALIQTYSMAKSDEFTLLTEVSDTMKAFRGTHKGWRRSLSDKIAQDFVYDNRMKVMFDMDRAMLIRIMLNWGNESNKFKQAQGIASAGLGYIATEEQTQQTAKSIDALIKKNAKKEDWEFVSQIWQVFKGWQKREEQVVRATSSKMPKWIESTPIDTGFEELGSKGVIEGGYIPLIEDKSRLLEGIERGIPKVDPKALMGPDFHRATTSRPHHLQRTSAPYFVDITSGIHNLAGRMQQHIHDIAFREFVMDAGKIINDKEIMHNVSVYHGEEYATQMKAWLHRVANSTTVPEAKLQGINDTLRFFRQNLVNAAIPGNYAIMLSPTTGMANLAAAQRMASDPNKEAVLKNSEELKHVMYTIDRDLTDQLGLVIGGKGAWETWDLARRRIVEWIMRESGYVWMEQQSRSVTFYDWFMHHKGQGLTDGEAAALADSKVRERHGVVAPGDLPPLLASDNEFIKTATLFQGWFSMIRNWQRQIPGQVRRGEYGEVMKVLWGTVVLSTLMNAFLFTKWKKDESWWSFISRAILDTPLGAWPYVRELWGYETEGRKPVNPIFSAAMSGDRFVREWWKYAHGDKKAQPFKATIGATGMFLGGPAAVQIGRTGQGLIDLATEAQKPRNLYELIRLVAQGEAKPKR